MCQKVCMNYYFAFKINIIRLDMGKTITERTREFRNRQHEAASFDSNKHKEKECKRIEELCQRQHGKEEEP